VGIDNQKFKFCLNGIVKNEATKKIIKKLTDELKLSGSIEYIKKNERSTYFFNSINSESVIHILEQLGSELEEVKIEIQTHDENAKEIQQKGFRHHDI
jgi:hypothetical protein